MNRNKTKGSPAGATDCKPDPTGTALPAIIATCTMFTGAAALMSLILDSCGA